MTQHIRLRSALSATTLLAALTLLSGCGAIFGCRLSDEEVIKVVVQRFLDEQPVRWSTTDVQKQTHLYDLAPYKSYEEFVSLNPNCCQLLQRAGDFGSPGFWSRWWYDFRGYVTIGAIQRRVTPDGIELIPMGFSYESAVNSCGDEIVALNFWE